MVAGSGDVQFHKTLVFPLSFRFIHFYWIEEEMSRSDQSFNCLVRGMRNVRKK